MCCNNFFFQKLHARIEENPIDRNFFSYGLLIGHREREVPMVMIDREQRNQVFFTLAPDANYVFELCQNGGITPTSQDYTAFCLSDFDVNKGKLKDKYFVFVKRKPIQFQDSWEWVYACSCHKGEAQNLQSLSRYIPLTMSDFYRGFNDGCLHKNAARRIMADFDARNDIDPESQFQIEAEDEELNPVYALMCTEDTVAIWDQERNEFGAVSVVRSHLSCSVCINSTNCNHVRILEELKGSASLPSSAAMMLERLEDEVEDRVDEGSRLSFQKIPFLGLNGESTGINKELKIFDRFDSDETLHLKPMFLPEVAKCSTCQCDWLSTDPILYKENIPLFMDIGIFNANVYLLKCSNVSCNCTFPYDGLEDGILNMNSYLVSHKLLKRFMLSFLHGRMPIVVFHTIYQREQFEEGYSYLAKCLSYNRFKNAWYNFMALQDIDLSNCFHCDICGEAPEVVIMDATSLSFRKEFTHWKSFLENVDRREGNQIPRLSHFHERIMIRNTRCRSLLFRYSGSKRKKTKPLSGEEYEELNNHLRENYPEIHGLVSYLQETPSPEQSMSSAHMCPSVWSPFIEALAAVSPVCGLVHRGEDLDAALESFIENGGIVDADLLALFEKKFPMLHKLIISFHAFRCPQQLLPVLTLLIEKSKAPFVRGYSDAFLFQDEFPESPYSFWPSLEQLRRRGWYELDAASSSKARQNCHKMSKGHPTLLPGVFTMFCEHEICYGFEIMLTNESPDVPFTVLYTRFLNGPYVVIYDNACNLHDYCLNRSPGFFIETKFLVDRLHWKNHTGCSGGYNMAAYPDLKHINSQINEQMNSCLKRIKPSLSYMRHDHFVDHTKLFLAYRNMMTKERRKPSGDTQVEEQ